jgi:hypothetical protein
MNEINDLVTRVNIAIKSDRIRRIALSSTLAIQKPRIFDQGRNENGGQIGKYSKKYGEMKAKLGKNPGYVNFRLTDQMMNDYGLVIEGDTYAFGFQNTTNGEKSGWLMDRYGEVFFLSDKEIELFSTVLNDEINKAIQ